MATVSGSRGGAGTLGARPATSGRSSCRSTRPSRSSAPKGSSGSKRDARTPPKRAKSSSAEMATGNLADVRILGVNHLGAACLGNLPEEQIGFRYRDTVLVLKPEDHLLESEAQRIIERPGASDCTDVALGLEAR